MSQPGSTTSSHKRVITALEQYSTPVETEKQTKEEF